MKRVAQAVLIALVSFPPGPPGAASTSAPAALERLILTPDPGTLLSVEADFPRRPGVCEIKQPKPVRARYRGRLEIGRESDGSLVIVNELPFSDYLKGLAEVPLSWPEQALRAQAIAARSYALATMAHPPASFERRGIDICASDRCQVYRGASVELGAFGERWASAVEDTRARVLVVGGSVIEAFYFSTSTGRTKTNAEAFGGSPRSYLRSVPAHDGDAPLARWEIRVPFGDLGAILRAGGRWPGGTIEGVAASGDSVTVSGASASRTFSRRALRTALNDEASCVFPGRYPTKNSVTGSALPLVVPSSAFSVSTQSGSMVLRGRGWGHGVGMSQYGARALAAEGWTAERILAHFYRGARVVGVAEPPVIRVLASEGLRRVRVSIEGRVSATTDTGSSLAAGDRFEASGGAALRLRRGIGPSLAPILAITGRAVATALRPGEDVVAAFTLNRAARVTATIEAGGRARADASGSFEAGDATLRISGTGLDSGDYTLRLEAFDGIDRVRAAAVAFTVAIPAARRTPGAGARLPWIIAAGGIASLGIVWGARRRARERRAPSGGRTGPA